MTFTPANLGAQVDSIGGGLIRIFGYRTTESRSAVLAPGYFTNAAKYRLCLGDYIAVNDGVSLTFMGIISDIDADGHATLVIADGAATVPWFDDIVPEVHLKRFSETASPVVVLVGDSTATLFANGLSAQDTLSLMLQDYLVRKNPHKAITFYNRAIGGTSFAIFLSGPDGAAPYTPGPQFQNWYTDVNQDWIDYAEDLEPDLLVIHFGTNETWLINPLAMGAIYSAVSIWAKVPSIIFTTNLGATGDKDSVFGTFLEQNGRDQAAGFIRTYAEFLRVGILDFNRAYNGLTKGIDVRNSYSERVLTSESVDLTEIDVLAPTGAKNTIYEAEEDSIRHYACEVTFSAIPSTFWGVAPGDGLAPVKFRLSGVQSPMADFYPDAAKFNDLLLWRDAATGDLFWNVRLRRESAVLSHIDTYLYVSPQDTNIAAPTSGDVTLRLQVHDGRLRLTQKTGTHTETVIINQLIARMGGTFAPAFGYDGVASGRPTEATFTLDVGRDVFFTSAALSATEAWGEASADLSTTRLPYGGNGNNHPSSALARQVFGAVLGYANLSAPAITVAMSAAGGGRGIGTVNPLAKLHVAQSTGASGVLSLSAKGTTGAWEGLNGVGVSFLTSAIGTAYSAVYGDPDNNDQAWIQYSHVTDRHSFYNNDLETLSWFPAVAAAWDPGSLLNGERASTNVTVTGAAVGDFALASHTSILSGAHQISAAVTGANTVTASILNTSGGTVDLASGTLKVFVIKSAAA